MQNFGQKRGRWSLKRGGRLIQWQIIVKIVGRVSKWSFKTGGRSIRVVVMTILTVVTEDPSEIANAFNDFFINVTSKIKEPINPSNHDKLKDFCKSKISQETTFAIPAVEKEKVLKYLSNMDISKATGTDSIGARLLKLAAPCIAEDITFICNNSNSSSCCHDKWKVAKVSPCTKTVRLKKTTIVQSQFYLFCLRFWKNMFQIALQCIWMKIIYFIRHNLALGHIIHVRST